MSPAITVLLLGLPVVDIIAVLFLRAKHKMNLFKASRNHVHHRLLDIGFHHYESVIFIYTVQFVLAISAIFLMYENDLLVLVYYLAICSSVFIFLTLAERSGLKLHENDGGGRDIISVVTEKFPRMKDLPLKALESGLSFFIIASAVIVSEVPVDFAISSLIFILVLLVILFSGFLGFHLYRLILFVTIAFSVYLLTMHPAEWMSDKTDLVLMYFIAMAILGFIVIKTKSNEEFKVTPLDYLVIEIALLIEFLPGQQGFRENLIWMIIQIIILFYICEILVQNMQSRWNRFSGSVFIALALIAYRGLA